MIEDPRLTLIDASSRFYARGWMLGTAGNLSTRADDSSFWITASGKNKGELKTSDFLRVDLDGEVLEGKSETTQPSAETSIHRVIYREFPDARACFHVHTIESNLVCRFPGVDDRLVLPELEMLKGFGVMDERPVVGLDIFENHAHVLDIAEAVAQRLSTVPPRIPAFLIRNHGSTVWAGDARTAENYLELLDYIFRFMVAERRASLSG